MHDIYPRSETAAPMRPAPRHRPRPEPRVAIIHYWLVGMRGGERVLESLCRMFPQADIVTHVAVPERLSETLRRHRIVTTRIAGLPFAARAYQKYLPLMPRALEEVDLTGYDIVISSEAGPAKGVIAPPDAPHLCYCHSPMRYLWDQYHVYRDGAGLVTRAMMPMLAHRLRQWDVSSAARVDGFAANSHHVADRISKYWRREARVVHPPVAVEDFAPVAREEVGDFYLWAGELAPYKRPDLAVEAMRRLDRPFVVIGGPDATMQKLRRQAGPKTRFLGKVPFETLKSHMARCKALIFPGEEDFGIIPVEAMASGRPVIAYGRGGACDTVIDGETGLLFRDQSVEGLMAAVEAFEAAGLGQADPAALVRHAAGFNEARFQEGIRASLAELGAI
ncbi:glycosyltransferase involved in cell wall biosynthesis [Limimaricola variabilis]|uniref:Glycosyltransferase involved in cell wall biosynthesis n=1 Tax=Limimaricola variabilis TaxID=1492771 RepID=A0ABR6HNE9_9RHOB|nr:glycosyltransferase [Limimaricola variabilis]MBB3711869.1 glycosyltransferase involved in cell wall biosynthesis [Limimaricola variabilis]